MSWDVMRASARDGDHVMPCAGNQREGLVRVVRLMLTHGRVAVTMRGDKTRSDAVSPQNGIDGARTRLMKS